MTPVDLVTTSQNPFWYEGAFSKWAFGKVWILAPRKELPAIRQGLNPKNHRRIWKFPTPPWWGPMPVPHQEHQPLSRREESLVWYLSNLWGVYRGFWVEYLCQFVVLNWIVSFMSFQFSTSASVFVLFALLFPLFIPLCAPNLQNKSISAFCTNFAFRRISFGFKQKRLLRKKPTCQVSSPSCRALISMAAGFLAKKSQPPHI